MDKNFLDLLTMNNPKNIGRITLDSLKNLKFKVKIYNSRPTNIGPIMI